MIFSGGVKLLLQFKRLYIFLLHSREQLLYTSKIDHDYLGSFLIAYTVYIKPG